MVNPYLKFLDHHHTEIIRLLEGVAIAATVPFDAEGAIPSIIEYAEGTNLAWDQIDQYSREVNATLDDVKSVYAEGSRGHKDVQQKVALINSTVDKHKPNMGNKSKKLNSGVAEMPRSHSMPVLETRTGGAGGSKAGNRAATEHFALRSPQTPVTSNSLTTNLKYFDSHLIEGPSEKTLTQLNVKIGKQLYPDVITPFLKNLSGHGKIRMQFAGRCISAQNKRHVHIQMFRHRLSDNITTTGGAWPTGTIIGAPGTANFILGPQNTTVFQVGGPTSGITSQLGYGIGKTSFRDILNKGQYWAPYNKADLEDLSWNLNGLKLDNGLWEPQAPTVTAVAVAGQAAVVIPVDNIDGFKGAGFERNVPLFKNDDHARMSMISQNNNQAVVIPTSTNLKSTRTGAYRYNAVFNKGSIEYDFMNKGLGGAKIELIIYRLKKNFVNTQNGNSYGNSSKQIHDLVSQAIGQGYLETCIAKGGTDALLGRPPVASDVSENPAFPFLPKLKKTKEMKMPFIEVSRQTFAMPSGARRVVKIDLPGEIYDPANISPTILAPGTDSYPPILDNGTYGVMMSVSGVRCTNEMHNTTINDPTTPQGNYNLGDMFAAANVQFYGTYTEHMGACQYKEDKAVQMYTQGDIITSDTTLANWAMIPVTMLPQDSATRTGVQPGPTDPTAPIVGKSNLRFDFDASASPDAT